jgi:hypothetical protein
MRARKSRDEWAAIIAEFEGCGQPLERFCSRRRILAATFRWWRWQLRDADGAPLPTDEVRFVPVDVVRTPPPVLSTAPVVIVVSGVEVRVDVGADPAYVAALVGELRSRC